MKNTKKLLGLILAAVLALSLLDTPALAADSDGIIAAPIEYTLSVDGKSVSLWAYKIGGGMYFKLRDLAMALSGTEKQFDISWTFDSDYMGIDLLSGRAYMSIGSELSAPSNHDYGMTWTYDETYNLACQWAEAVKNRDGRAQYALLSSGQQKESYDGYVSFDWVTGASSPWVDDYTVKLTSTGAVITYKWASSTGPDGVSVTTLTFVRENGALRIGGITGTQIEADVAAASQTLPGQFLQKLVSATDEKIISVQCDDFDDDGKREAFVLTGKGNLNEGGNLWFISEDGVIKLNNMYLYSLPEMIQIGEQKFIKYEEEYATGRSLFLLDVENGKAKSVISGNAQDFTQMPDGTFTVQQNTLDMLCDGTGRTLKPYWLYYDNVFHEYGAIEITQAQLLEFAGANNILKQIEAEGGTVKSILYRNNHIININYQTDQGMNRYVNLKYNDTSVSVLQTDNGSGVYLAALLPDIATYPASFHHPNK